MRTHPGPPSSIFNTFIVSFLFTLPDVHVHICNERIAEPLNIMALVLSRQLFVGSSTDMLKDTYSEKVRQNLDGN